MDHSPGFLKIVNEARASVREITIEQLLHHTGGLQDYFDVFGKKGKGAITSHRYPAPVSSRASP